MKWAKFLIIVFFSINIKTVIEDYIIVKFDSEINQQRLSQFYDQLKDYGLTGIEYMGIPSFYSVSVQHPPPRDINDLLQKIKEYPYVRSAYIDVKEEIKNL